MSKDCVPITVRRTRISRFEDENERCKASNRPNLLSASFLFMRRSFAGFAIHFAAYVVTDWPVMQALMWAADRGVKVRIYLDATQLAECEPTKVFEDLTHKC